MIRQMTRLRDAETLRKHVVGLFDPTFSKQLPAPREAITEADGVNRFKIREPVIICLSAAKLSRITNIASQQRFEGGKSRIENRPSSRAAQANLRATLQANERAEEHSFSLSLFLSYSIPKTIDFRFLLEGSPSCKKLDDEIESQLRV